MAFIVTVIRLGQEVETFRLTNNLGDLLTDEEGNFLTFSPQIPAG